MKHKLLLIAAMIIGLGAMAQSQVNFKINHKLGGANFGLNQMATNGMSQAFQLTRMEYYISNIVIIHDNGTQTPIPKSTLYLVDANAPFNANLGSYNVTNVEGIKFSIGVDTPENHSDPTTWPTGHPLAPRALPLKQMNWAWPAGYRFIAMEGIVGTNTNNRFEIHSLEDQYYYSQTVMAAGTSGTNGIDINLDADYIEALRSISIVDGGNSGITEHGSSNTNILSLQNFRDHVFTPSFAVGTNDIATNLNVNIYPNPSKGLIYIDLQNNEMNVSDIEILDITGKLIDSKEVTTQTINAINLATPGIYLLKLNNHGVNLGTQKVVIK